MESALIALAGVFLGGLLTGWFQRRNTSVLVAAEFDKLKAQFEIESRKRQHEVLVANIPQLIAATDPELHANIDYATVTTIINRIEVMLNPKYSCDAELNDAVLKLGFTVRESMGGERDVSQLLGRQSAVVAATRKLLREPIWRS